MNTPNGTVKGRLEGPEKPIVEMQKWLRTKGSPRSKIEKAIFTEMKEAGEPTGHKFEIRT